MVFELIKEIPESYIEDKDRGIVMKKKSGYGRRFSIFEITKGPQVIEFEVEKNVKDDGTYWDVFKVSYPEGSVDSDKVIYMDLIKECMEAYKHLQYSSIENTQYISYSIA